MRMFNEDRGCNPPTPERPRDLTPEANKEYVKRLQEHIPFLKAWTEQTKEHTRIAHGILTQAFQFYSRCPHCRPLAEKLQKGIDRARVSK